MEINQSISNPMLVGAMELLHADDTPEHRNIFLGEVMKATFLAPVVIDPPPVADEQGLFSISPGSQIQFPMLQAPDGKRFFMAYTDWEELRKWKNQHNRQTLGHCCVEYTGMLLRRDQTGNTPPAAGFVINPYGGNMAMTKELIASMLAPKPPQP